MRATTASRISSIPCPVLAEARMAPDPSRPMMSSISLRTPSDPEGVRKEIEDIIGLDGSGAILASAKTGQGIEEILEAVVARIPPPKGEVDKQVRVLLPDSWYERYT